MDNKIDNRDIQDNLKRFAMLAYSNFETIHHSYDTALRCIKDNIKGAFVECGVAAGSQIAAMAYACIVSSEERPVYLFDSFCGIPLAGPEDDSQPGIGKITHDVNVPKEDLLKTSGISACNVESVVGNLKKWGVFSGNMRFIKGWFQHTLPQSDVQDIAILRLDGDLYESTKVCLESLYGKVVKGGYVIVDDYALTGCKKAVHEFMGDDFNYNVVPNTQTVIYWKKK